jgi:hypothetical protein
MACPTRLMGRLKTAFRWKRIGQIGNRWIQFLICLVGWSVFSLALPFPAEAWVGGPVGASASQPAVIQVAQMTLPNPIFKRWTHSREEDQGDVLTYRPSDYPFPPARGREGLEFRQNGEFIRYEIGATDRSLGVAGRWSIQSRNVVRVEFSNQSAPSQTVTILECDDQILKLSQTAGAVNQ